MNIAGLSGYSGMERAQELRGVYAESDTALKLLQTRRAALKRVPKPNAADDPELWRALLTTYRVAEVERIWAGHVIAVYRERLRDTHWEGDLGHEEFERYHDRWFEVPRRAKNELARVEAALFYRWHKHDTEIDYLARRYRVDRNRVSELIRISERVATSTSPSSAQELTAVDPAFENAPAEIVAELERLAQAPTDTPSDRCLENRSLLVPSAQAPVGRLAQLLMPPPAWERRPTDDSLGTLEGQLEVDRLFTGGGTRDTTRERPAFCDLRLMESSFSVPNDKGVSNTCHEVCRLLRKRGFREEDCENAIIVLRELVDNVRVHVAAGKRHAYIQLLVQRAGSNRARAMELRVGDDGDGFKYEETIAELQRRVAFGEREHGLSRCLRYGTYLAQEKAERHWISWIRISRASGLDTIYDNFNDVVPIVLDYGKELVRIDRHIYLSQEMAEFSGLGLQFCRPILEPIRRSPARIVGIEIRGKHPTRVRFTSTQLVALVWSYRCTLPQRKPVVVFLDTEDEDHRVLCEFSKEHPREIAYFEHILGVDSFLAPLAKPLHKGC